MRDKDAEPHRQRWARLRFSIIGPLLSSPPSSGQLRDALQRLAQSQWLHPITNTPVRFGLSTIERWYYQARDAQDPVGALQTKPREDAGCHRQLSASLVQRLRSQYQAHKSWSYQLHTDNLHAVIQSEPELGAMPSYSTVRRYMKANGLIKQRRQAKSYRAGQQLAEKRLETREVRSYEVDHINGLWHLDYHHGSRKIVTMSGRWVTPMLLAIMDDRSRVICHAQWYLDETAESLVHGFSQAIQKRALPRALMSDNGAAMVAAEFTQGLERLGIVHQTTLPYSPYQNAKQEFFWTNIEGRLLPMLEGETQLTLALLNRATQAWVEREYHHKHHSEIGCTPLHRYLNDPQVGRTSPSSENLRCAFRIQIRRKQRRSDGTLSLAGQRFEVPSRFRHCEYLYLQYARWDLSAVDLIDTHNNTILCRLYPLDKSTNASGLRRTLNKTPEIDSSPAPGGIAPLLQQLMADYAATGLPPAYIPKDDLNTSKKEDRQ
jgi:putative transposase